MCQYVLNDFNLYHMLGGKIEELIRLRCAPAHPRYEDVSKKLHAAAQNARSCTTNKDF